jgi:hypothetical protein
MELPGTSNVQCSPERDPAETGVRPVLNSDLSLCPKVENVEFTNFKGSMRDVLMFSKNLNSRLFLR